MSATYIPDERDVQLMQDVLRSSEPWPMGILLPVKNRIEGQPLPANAFGHWPLLGVMLRERDTLAEDGVKRVYLTPLDEILTRLRKESLGLIRERLAQEGKVREYPDTDALLQAGWVVD